MLGRAVAIAAAVLAAAAPAVLAAATATVLAAAAPTGLIGAATAGSQADANTLAGRAAYFHGQTSQHQPISFTLRGGEVRKLDFWIVITCPSHHRYRLRASGFAAIAVHSARFARTFSSPHAAASATITGRVRRARVTGTLHLRRSVTGEAGSCAGTATYALAG